MYRASINTPIGTAILEGTEQGLSRFTLSEEEATHTNIPPCLEEPIRQITEYFNGQRTTFSLQLVPKGTPFQRSVWTALEKIPYGSTVSYAELSKKLGDIKAIRAVAAANGKNPLWIIIPCHRVIGSDGSLTGYAGGLWRKKWLLSHEQGFSQTTLF
ncbi:methylated-DNA--[protein]-cysteine S-methyltransferase [Robertkochia marina]|uniref:Methylated-DNA--protein-cysteine methyltransferase n=1 Tax=Robertkochia marina TaxID=1227945 RepID=A0A4S3M501_9FLAO|nr:methylated-DNA--[protein]-cysteine S-methyltransferase [Robertkochia marina]THD69411.1 methylated-DNA--[protein]-cysteine S-methyltransferase [Robertkochia marina]TRZ47328.1 methylated-DNA--[protein]-cysteine S-methyltransferase [Robertkochia marina]